MEHQQFSETEVSKSAAPVQSSTPAQPSASTQQALTRRPTISIGRIGITLAAAIGITFLFDRTLAVLSSQWFTNIANAYQLSLLPIVAFWAAALVIVGALFWRYGKKIRLWWTFGVTILFLLAAALWETHTNIDSIAYTTHSSGDESAVHAVLSLAVVAPLLMVGFIYSATGIFRLKYFGKIIRTVLVASTAGWFVNLPYIGVWYRACVNHFGEPKTRAKRGFEILVALIVAVPLLSILAVLLSQADLVFQELSQQFIQSYDISSFVGHTAFVVIVGLFLSSVLLGVWVRIAAREQESKNTSDSANIVDVQHQGIGIPTLSMTLVLCALVALYTLFCGVQITYLFAGTRLPDGITYSQYARSGFFQLLMVVVINIIVFAVVVSMERTGVAVKALTVVLLAQTGVMLASAAWRLSLYVGAYGFTWLRLVSATFMVALAAVLLLALVRLFVPRLPFGGLCCVVLVAWWIALGWMNPSAFIEIYNVTHSVPAVLGY